MLLLKSGNIPFKEAAEAMLAKAAATKAAEEAAKAAYWEKVHKLAKKLEKEYDKKWFGNHYRVTHKPTGKESGAIYSAKDLAHGGMEQVQSMANDYIGEQAYTRAHRLMEDPRGYIAANAEMPDILALLKELI